MEGIRSIFMCRVLVGVFFDLIGVIFLFWVNYFLMLGGLIFDLG